jgi:hypothetical protein
MASVDHDQALRDLRRLESENRDLRQWLCDVLAALGNGSGALPSASMQFLSCIPQEVQLVVGELREPAVRHAGVQCGDPAHAPSTLLSRTITPPNWSLDEMQID